MFTRHADDGAMDREITFALLVATAATVLMGSYYFPSGQPAPTAFERATVVYEPDDIRYPLQQAERKALERQARTRPAAASAAGAP
ncbi:MAG: hypothetical protein ACK58T_43025 [Phycisphaerae bacterium]